MNDAKIVSDISAIVRSRRVFWVDGDYLRDGELVHWECFIRLVENAVAVGFDEYLEKYEDAVDLYDIYARNSFDSLHLAVNFVLNSYPLAAENIRRR